MPSSDERPGSEATSSAAATAFTTMDPSWTPASSTNATPSA